MTTNPEVSQAIAACDTFFAIYFGEINNLHYLCIQNL